MKHEKNIYLNSTKSLSRDKEFSQFEFRMNYGGGYEDDSFNFCNDCGKRLDVVVLPGSDDLERCIEQLKEGSEIDDNLGYECYWLLYNHWGKDDERHKECWS